MTIADRDGQPRSEFVQQQLGEPDSPLLDALSQRFVLRFFRFSSSADRLTGAGDLKYDGTATRLGPALDRARDELAGLPLAGLVMVTDGADTSDASLDESLASLKARSIPVFTVGVGQEHFRPRHPGHARRDAALDAQGHVAGRRRRAHADRLRRPDGAAQRRRRRPHRQLAGGHAAARRRVGDRAGALHRQRSRPAAVPVPDSRRRPASRSRRTTRATRWSRSRDRSEKVLYFEGEPRFEMKFIRRAVEDDKNLQVVDPAAHRRGQVPAARRRQPRRAGRRLSQDARGAVRLPRDHPRQRRSRVVLARSAAHARRLRQQARRRSADARRPPRVRRRRLGRHAGRRSAAGRARQRRPRKQHGAVLLAALGAADARRRHLSGDAARRHREGLDARSGTTCRRSPPSTRSTRSSRARPSLLTGDRRQEAGSGRARLSALRPRQGARAADPGLVDLEDGRHDPGHRHDPRDVLAAAGPLAGRRRARSGRRSRRRSIASSRASR